MRHGVRQLSAQQHDIRLNEIDAPVEVRRHPSARRMTLRVSRTRRAVIVTLPLQCDLAQAGAFLTTHIDWVRERLGHVPQPVPLADGAVIPLRGEPRVLSFGDRSGTGGVVSACRTVDGRLCLAVAGEPEHGARRLRDWLIGEARNDLDARVQWHTSRLGVRARRIAIRDQSSRWGSCSTTGALSFSWRLVLAPPAILDYVAAHEVAHLAEMNHGPRFWALVAKTYPDLEAARSWLARFGTELHRYAPSA